MKKVLSILLLLGLLSILCQFIINLSIDHHTVKYSIKTANNDYYVSENFRRIGDNSVYDLPSNNSLMISSFKLLEYFLNFWPFEAIKNTPPFGSVL